MANYAYVENNLITQLFEELPTSWKNISNFNLLDSSTLQDNGFYTVVKVVPQVTENTRVNPNPSYNFVNGVAYESYSLENITEDNTLTPEQIAYEWEIVRLQRDELMNNFEWRYTRYDRQSRLGLEPIDNLQAMDSYMQSLADITTQDDPFNIIWPEYTA
jgi:Phage tail assembly chaperone protein